MKYLLLIPLLLFFSLCGSDSDSEATTTITITSPHVSYEPDENAERVLMFLCGGQPTEIVHQAFIRRLQVQVHRDPSVRRLVKVIESSDTSSDASEDDPVSDLKKILLEAIQEAVEEKHLEAAEAVMQLKSSNEQLSESEKELRTQKYRFYAAAATACTSMAGVVTAMLAYNVS